MGPILLVVSADTRRDAALGPRRDYALLGQRFGADVVDRGAVEADPLARALSRAAGYPLALALLAWRRRRGHAAIFADGEHVGLPLAFLLRLSRAREPLVVIGHRVSARKKRPFFTRLRLHERIGTLVLHSPRQLEIAERELGVPRERLALVPYQVDTEFWCPDPETPREPLVVAVGLEHRDYATLTRAVVGSPARVVIAAGSHWARSQAQAAGPLPGNVSVGRYDYQELRALYARASVVVVPLVETDFQAGITSILEAMAMACPVIVTLTSGRSDVVRDRRAQLRASALPTTIDQAAPPRLPNGFYVAPDDAGHLRAAIDYLLAHPAEARALGENGRAFVSAELTVEGYVGRLADVLTAVSDAADDAAAATSAA